jgi:hypothetical protein
MGEIGGKKYLPLCNHWQVGKYYKNLEEESRKSATHRDLDLHYEYQSILCISTSKFFPFGSDFSFGTRLVKAEPKGPSMIKCDFGTPGSPGYHRESASWKSQCLVRTYKTNKELQNF